MIEDFTQNSPSCAVSASRSERIWRCYKQLQLRLGVLLDGNAKMSDFRRFMVRECRRIEYRNDDDYRHNAADLSMPFSNL